MALALTFAVEGAYTMIMISIRITEMNPILLAQESDVMSFSSDIGTTIIIKIECRID